MTKGSTIVDDRGREVPAFELRSYLVGLDVRSIPHEERELLSKVQLAGVVSNGGGLASGKLSGILVGGAMVLSMIATRIWLSGSATWERVVLTAGFTYALLVAIGFFVKDPGRVRTARTLVSHGRCGSCFYPLGQVMQDADGMTQCPECGAAWNALNLRSLVSTSAWSGTVDSAVQLTPGGTLQARLAVIEDDRGRLVFAVDPTLEELKKRFSEREASEIALKAGAGVLQSHSFHIVGMALLVICLLRVAWNPGSLGLPMVAFPFVVVLFVGVSAIGLTNLIREYRRARKGTDQGNGEKIRRRLLSAGRCPTCATNINGVQPETDGCRVCPCCGGAWKGVTGKK
jgi:hypothetical protein